MHITLIANMKKELMSYCNLLNKIEIYQWDILLSFCVPCLNHIHTDLGEIIDHLFIFDIVKNYTI